MIEPKIIISTGCVGCSSCFSCSPSGGEDSWVILSIAALVVMG